MGGCESSNVPDGILEGTVSIGKNGIDHSTDVPRIVEIKSGQTVMLNINIDTGTR